MSLKQKAIQGVIWSAIQQWGGQAGSLIVFLILARLLSPEAFGLVALANVFLAFMKIFLEQGFAQALIQRQEIEPEHLDTAFWTHVISGILLTVISFTCAGLVAAVFKQPQLTAIIKCLSFVFTINSLSHVQKALLARKFAFKVMAVRALIGIIIGGTVGIVMAFLGFGVWSIVSQQLVDVTVEVMVLWGASNWRPRLSFSGTHFRELYRFGINILGFQFLNFFNRRTDDLLIGYFLGEVALGYYVVAYRILQVMTQLLVSTSKQVALPTFSRLQTDLSRLRQAFYQATQFTSSIAFPSFFGVIALAPELVIFLFGDKWLASISVLQVLALAGILQSIAFFNGSVFMAVGKPAWRLYISLLNAVLNAIACLIAVRWGIVAVAWGYVISSYLAFPVTQWAVSKLVKIAPLAYLQKFLTPLIGSLVMFGLILSIKSLLINFIEVKILLIIAGSVVGIIVYSLTIRLLEPKLFKSLVAILQLVISKNKKVSLKN